MHFSTREIWAVRQANIAAFLSVFGVRADGDDPIVAGYRVRQEDLVQASNVLIAEADKAGRELSAAERTTIRDNSAEVERLEGEIELRASVAAQDARLRQPQARAATPNAVEPPNEDPQDRAMARTHVQTTHISTAATRAAGRGNGGFNTLGHFAQAVRAGTRSPGQMDNRLVAALSTYGNEGSGADGGFAVPPDFRTDIMGQMMSEQALFGMCDTSPTSSNRVTLLSDETTPWSTSGIRVYTRAEAAAMTQSKPLLKDLTVNLHEIYALVPMTDEVMEDAPLLASHLSSKVGEALQFKLSDWIVNGTGAGQMLGIMNAPCKVTVAKETSQTAATVHADNIVKMWARMPGSVRSRAVWLVNQDVEPQLMQLGSVVKTAAGVVAGAVPAYLPPGGLSASPYGTLLGRPVITTEACAAAGTEGDIILAYMPGYFAPFKAGGVKSDVSMHLFFDQGVTAFRWVLRAGGQPWLSTPITRKSGSNTLSHFVTLAVRA